MADKLFSKGFQETILCRKRNTGFYDCEGRLWCIAVIECKPETKDQSRFDVIAIGISGQNEIDFRITPFIVPKGCEDKDVIWKKGYRKLETDTEKAAFTIKARS